jgi:hypothetical protein
MGFKEMQKNDDFIIFEHDLQHIPDFPDYIQVSFEVHI